MQNEINDLIKHWSESLIFDSDTRNEIKDLISKGATQELTDRFYRDLEFGTGGLRGILGAGTSRVNSYNIRRASCSLGLYLKEFYKSDALRVAITYDSRNKSREFAVEASKQLAAMGIRSLITKELRPVPLLSFMVRHYSCHAGICITASHNPPDYNGFKVYWTCGGQLVPPHDAAIIKHYKSNPELPQYKDADSQLIEWVGSEVDEAYIDQVGSLKFQEKGKDQISIAYSSLHGSGGSLIPKILNRFGIKNVFTVKEQDKPDGQFPTVESPNPESREALALCEKLALDKGTDLIMATDPDADRLGIAQVIEGKPWYLNGNQLGALLADYVIASRIKNGSLPANPMIIKTIVTSNLISKICESYEIPCFETLTGFKWICALVEKHRQLEAKNENEGKRFLFGCEESFGFLTDDFVRDKDAVSTAYLVAEMTAFYKSQGITLRERLHQLHKKHGCFVEDLQTFTASGKSGSERISQIMSTLRSEPPITLCGTHVISLRDYHSRQEMSCEDGKFFPSQPLDLPQSNVLQFTLQDGSLLTVRPSGTEPKIKFYVSVRSEVGLQSPDRVAESLGHKAEGIIYSLRKFVGC